MDLLNDLIVVKELGSGATGKVYLVNDKVKNCTFAAKIVPKKSYSEKEIALWKLITGHVNLVSFVETISTRDTVCILMEPVNGMDLYDLIDNSSLFLDEIVKYFRQLLQAVDFIHKKGICHLDIKPENIMIDLLTDTVKLIDYDSCEVGEIVKSSKGTLHFIPPERFQNELGPFDGKKADIWACGIVLYEMVTQEHPFIAEDETFPSDMVLRVAKGNYVPSTD